MQIVLDHAPTGRQGPQFPLLDRINWYRVAALALNLFAWTLILAFCSARF